MDKVLGEQALKVVVDPDGRECRFEMADRTVVLDATATQLMTAAYRAAIHEHFGPEAVAVVDSMIGAISSHLTYLKSDRARRRS